MPTVKELRQFIKDHPKEGCPQPSLGGKKEELLTKAKQLGYKDETEKKKRLDKIKDIRKQKKKQRVKTPKVLTPAITKQQQAAVNLKKEIKTVWRGKTLKNKVKTRKKPTVQPMWGTKSNEVRKNLAQTQRYWG